MGGGGVDGLLTLYCIIVYSDGFHCSVFQFLVL